MKKNIKAPEHKKENWFKVNAAISINTDTAPKWFKAKIKEVQKNQNLTEEKATIFLIKCIDKILSEKVKNINITKESFNQTK